MAAPRSQRSTIVASAAVVFSAALHGVVVLVGASLLSAGWFSRNNPTPPAPSTAAAPQPSVRTIDIELPSFRGETLPNPAASAVAAATPDEVSSLPSGTDTPRPDTGHRGRGGTNRSTQPGVNLADHDHGIRLVRSVASHIDRDQLSRILSSSVRQSWENQRLTTHPMELTFLASGKGERHERREPANHDPSSGQSRARPASTLGAERLGLPPAPAGVGYAVAEVGGDTPGSDYESLGVGVAGTAPGNDHRASADVAYARPMVDKGKPSIPSPKSGSPKDNVDAAQQVALARQSLMNASTAGGREGQGPGGQDGSGPTGFGGLKGPGSRSQPLGYGPGGNGWNGKDPRLSMYRRRLLAKLYPYWEDAFPKWAAAEMRQGRVIISVTILPDGTVRTAQVSRPSGIDEFDRNCLRAIHEAAPFEPFPRNFPLAVLRWELSFDASNPLVR